MDSRVFGAFPPQVRSRRFVVGNGELHAVPGKSIARKQGIDEENRFPVYVPGKIAAMVMKSNPFALALAFTPSTIVSAEPSKRAQP